MTTEPHRPTGEESPPGSALRDDGMPTERRHLHVAAAIDHAVRGLGEIAVPLVIGLVAGGRHSSGSAILLGLLGVVAVAAIGIARWRSTTYHVSGRALHFRSGVFSPDETVVPLERIQSVDTIAGPVQRLFGVSGLHVQTPGGGESGEIELSALSARAAAQLRAALGHPDQDRAAMRRRLGAGALLVTALTAPQLGVLLPVVGAVFGALQNGLLGAGEAEVEHINSTGQVVLVVAVLLVAAWLLSFLGAVVAFSGFEVQRADGRLWIRRGLLQWRAVSVPVGRIDGVQIVESPLRRPFGLVALRVEVTSLSEGKTAARTLFPLMHRAEIEPFLETFLDELAGPLTLDEHPPARARRRYLTLPVSAALALSAALVIAVPVAWPAAPVLVALAVLSGLDAFAAAGLRVAEGDTRVVVRGRRWGARVTLVARRRRLQELDLSRNPLQRRAGLATISITVARGTRLGVRHVERTLAVRVLTRLAPPRSPI
jgi:putative membrane protein